MTMFEVRECSNKDCRLRLPMNPSEFSGAYCPRCGEPMVRVLGPYQNSKCSTVDIQPKRKVSALLDNIRSAYNVGAMFRTADGAGLQHLYLCGITPTPTDQETLRKTALGAEENVPWSTHPNAILLAKELRGKGLRLVGLECTSKSLPIDQYLELTEAAQSLILVVGNERSGIDPGLLDLCDEIISLPMIGRKVSLNVAVAFGIAAYWLSFGR